MKNQDLQLVTFEQAQRLKKAGFDWPTTPYYTFSGLLVDNLPRKEKMANGKYPTFFCPTVALALKWMRDEKGFAMAVGDCHLAGNIYDVEYMYSFTPHKGPRTNVKEPTFPTYESAESALLDELLTLLETK